METGGIRSQSSTLIYVVLGLKPGALCFRFQSTTIALPPGLGNRVLRSLPCLKPSSFGT